MLARGMIATKKNEKKKPVPDFGLADIVQPCSESVHVTSKNITSIIAIA